ncbi:MAG: cell division ATP-binding protein FtsE [Candidatus Eisenbacteria bacterium]|uniref:Cell division ATP-binding protein FtsE n=1 Tax=Eiseniibacteriota bacterium TaxID=2212470 RepID=A0A7Y2EBQ5_UNCEI|nr:cell division ATP-binding protein FtsE [Candidatus Eisenbacteria bacterium]
MIKLFHVTKQYRPEVPPALEDVNLTLEDGEFVYLVGASGAGKSTLLKLILMQEFPTHGEVVVAGFTTAGMTRKKILTLRRRVGMVFQDFRLLQDRSVFENVALPLRLFGNYSDYQIRDRVNNVLDQVGLGHKDEAFPTELSGGEQQRVALARAISNRPFVLLADEPTANLDPYTSEDIINTIRRIHKAGTSVILATHKMELVENSGERYVRLDNGTIVEDWVDPLRGVAAR